MSSLKLKYSLLLALLLAVRSVCISAALEGSLAGHQADEQRSFVELKASDGLADNSAQAIKCTFTGRMVVTTIGNINFYDGVQFSHISTRDEHFFPLSNYQGRYRLYFDRLHHLWLKSSGGVSCVNLTTEKYIGNVDSVFTALGMAEKVTDMFVDDDGNVWLEGKSHIYNGKSRYQLMSQANLQDLAVYNGHLLLFYGNGEVMDIDMKTERVVSRSRAYAPSDEERYERSCSVVRCDDMFYQVRSGNMEGVLLGYDPKSRQWTTLLATDYPLNSINRNGNTLYVASARGYWTYDLATGATQHYESITLDSGRQLITDVNDIEFDKLGGMWIGTEKRGLLYSRLITKPFRSLSLDNAMAREYADMMERQQSDKIIDQFGGKKANCLYMDSRRWTWVGTTHGLYIYRSPEEKPQRISRSDGLMNDVVHAIIEDDRHNIWISTSYGISCVVLNGDKVKVVTSYNTLDNVPNETFIDGRAIKLPDGTIAMQALDHVVVFNPNNFKMLNREQIFKLYPKLTRLLVNGNEVGPGVSFGGNVILEKAVSRTDEVNLNYDQNSISMTFSGLNYIRPIQTFYRVKVDGLDSDWRVLSYYNSQGKVDRNGQLHLPLTGLKPGTYKVSVQVSMFPDEWHTDPYVWTVNVNEPWWRATGMYWLLGLVLLVLLVANFLLYNRNTRMRMQRNNDEGDFIRRVLNFVERCDSMEGDLLAPTEDDLFSTKENASTEQPQEFIDIMLKIVPFVHERRGREVTMRQLSYTTDVDILELYEVLSEELYKSPRHLVRTMRLQKAADMLSQTSKTIEEVAIDCGFASPNYFIANFYHKYRMTPMEYCEELAGN